MAAEYLANAVQEIALNAPAIFTASIPCRRGYIYHEDETGIFILRGITNQCFATYQVTFNGNIAIPEGGMSYDDGMVEELRDLMDRAPDEATKREFHKLITRLEQM